MDLIHDLFVRTADENYITARWCSANNLHVDFFWLSVHSIEKYLKAILLINGQTARSQGHDIVSLHENVLHISGDLIPDNLDCPKIFSPEKWGASSTRNFIENLYQAGNADNRYLLYGYMFRTSYLFKLDTFVFAVRRLICRLDEIVFPDEEHTRSRTFRWFLQTTPDYVFSMNMPIDKLLISNYSPLRHAFLNMNLAFAPLDYVHDPIPEGWEMRNAAIVRRILEPLESDNFNTVLEGIAVWEWLRSNIKIPGSNKNPGIYQQLEAAVTREKLKNCID